MTGAGPSFSSRSVPVVSHPVFGAWASTDAGGAVAHGTYHLGRNPDALHLVPRSRSAPDAKDLVMTRPRPPIRAAAAARLSRRSVLRGAGALGAAAALAACGGGGDDEAAPEVPSPAEDTSSADTVVRWASWPLYLDGDPAGQTHPTLDAFSQEAALTAEYTADVDDNLTYWAGVHDQLAKGEDIGRDVVVLSDWMAARMVQRGYAQELPSADLANRGNVVADLADVPYDPGRTHTLTWQTGFTGIAWDKEQVPGGLRNVADLWRAPLRGRVVVLSEMRDTVGLIMLDDGVVISGEDWGDDEFLAALDVLQTQLDTGQVRQVRGSAYTDDLVAGRAAAAIAWSGDIAQLNAQYGDRFGFRIPDAGGALWHDDLFVPVGSPHLSNAARLIDHYYDPAVAAQVAAAVRFAPPVEGAREAMASIDPALVDDPLLFPTEDFLQTVQPFRTLTEAEDDRYSTEFAKVLGG